MILLSLLSHTANTQGQKKCKYVKEWRMINMVNVTYCMYNSFWKDCSCINSNIIKQSDRRRSAKGKTKKLCKQWSINPCTLLSLWLSLSLYIYFYIYICVYLSINIYMYIYCAQWAGYIITAAVYADVKNCTLHWTNIVCNVSDWTFCCYVVLDTVWPI